MKINLIQNNYSDQCLLFKYMYLPIDLHFTAQNFNEQKQYHMVVFLAHIIYMKGIPFHHLSPTHVIQRGPIVPID